MDVKNSVLNWGRRLRRWRVAMVASFGVGLPLFAAHPLPLSPQAQDQIRLLHEEKISRTPIQRKMDSQLVFALRQKHQGFVGPGLNRLQVGAVLDKDGRLLVDLHGTVSAALLQFIGAQGGSVINSFPRANAVRALVDLDTVEKLAARADVRSVRPADQATTNVGVAQEGDVAHHADTARSFFQATGKGVKVGVLSDSVRYLAQEQAAGALPNVTILPGQEGVGSGEGTAMLEIVHALAPQAELFFATAFNSAASFAQNIRDLQAAGCRIIVDDVTYFNESPLFDGPISQAVNDVSAAGTLFFSSAGNSGNKNDQTSGTWEGDFADGGPAPGKAGRLHNFGGTTFNTVLPGGVRRLDLFWSDPPGQSTNDYDVYVMDSSGFVVRSSNNVQDGTGDAYESIPTLNVGDRIVIVKFSGESRYLSLLTWRGFLAISTPGSTRGHNASGATNAFCVAATHADPSLTPFVGGSANPVETFSSDGPRHVFFNPDGSAITPGDFSETGGALLQKPDFTAADGVTTTVPGFGAFYGTSAAAPHAAAITAMLWSLAPSLTPLGLRNLLTSTALDIEAPGVDRDSGAGIVMAYQALDAAAPAAWLQMQNLALVDANANGWLDADECGDVVVTLRNLPGATRPTAMVITATLTTTSPGVLVDPAIRLYPDLSAGASATSTVPFRISTTPAFVCGTNASFVLHLSGSNQLSQAIPFQLNATTSGLDTPRRFTPTDVPLAIPDLTSIESGVSVAGLDLPPGRVRVGVYLNHTFDYDLRLSLISPAGTEALLSAYNGGTGHDYGISCETPTIFSDDAPNAISAGSAPFAGSFRPQQALSVFNGKDGAAVNGQWRLRVRDESGLDAGTLQCWWLELSPIACGTGGGQCLIAPAIVHDIGDQVATNGDTIQLSVTANGTEPMTYSWFFNQTNLLQSSTNSALVLSHITTTTAGNYSVGITNAYGSATSATARISVVIPATIVSGPTNFVAANGGNARFEVQATGTAPLSYQWYFQNTQMAASAIFIGVTNPVLVISNVNLGMAGLYSVLVSNAYGQPVSPPATLSVANVPAIFCAPTRSVELATPWDFDLPTVTGSNITLSVQGTVTNLACGGTYSATRTWVATGEGGAQATCSQTINVVDTTPPLITCAGDKTVSYGSEWYFDAPTGRELGMTDTLVFDNSVHDLLLRFDPGTNEVGDEIILSGTERYLSRFSFGFWGENPVNGDFEGNVQARVRFYRNDGPLSPSGYPEPGTVIFDSGDFPIPAMPRATMLFEEFQIFAVVPLTVALPNVFTWTVQFSGLGPNDTAGLDLYSPPAVGMNFTDYWKRDRDQWSLWFNAAASMDFAARLEAISSGVIVTTLNTVTNAGCANSFIAQRAWRAADGCGNGITCTQTVTVTDSSPMLILTQPKDQTVLSGGTVAFSVTADGCPTLRYQWFFNQTNALAGATNAVLTLSHVTSAQAGQYSVTVSNINQVMSSLPATLAIVQSPSVSVPPQTQTVTVGGTAQFSVAADGTAPLTYQWFHNCATPIAGATSPTLTLTDVTLAQSGSYCAHVANLYGVTTSPSALLRVLMPPTSLSISRNGGVMLINFTTLTNLLYTVQHSDSIESPNWSNLPKGFRRLGTGALFSVPDAETAQGVRFYRVLVE